MGEIRSQLRRTVAAIADVCEADVGWTARCTDLPLVHTLNQVHVTTDTSVEAVLARADAHQSGLAYRHLVVDDPRTAEVLGEALAGWKAEREVLMAVAATPGRRVDTSRVTTLDRAETVGLMRRWDVEEHLDTTPGVIDQLIEYQLREGRAWDERCLGVREGGDAVAVTKLRSDGRTTAWVEDVYTVPEARGRGHARALVTYAVEQARAEGHRLIFIIADDNDWPKQLYADVGFRPVTFTWSFHADLAAP